MEWWSIEVFNGQGSAARWKDAHGEALVEAALTNGAVDWVWQEHRWGVVFEVAFLEEWRWERFYALPAVQAALDAAPDPVNGLLVHRGRGGSSGTRLPRRPRPLAGVGAVELPEPDPDPIEGTPWGRPGSEVQGSMTTGRRPTHIRRRWTNPPPSLPDCSCRSRHRGR